MQSNAIVAGDTLCLQMPWFKPGSTLLKAKTAAVLEEMGITSSDAVRMLLTRTSNEGALPFPMFGKSGGTRCMVSCEGAEAIDDPRPEIAHDEVKAHFARRRTAAAHKKTEDDI